MKFIQRKRQLPRTFARHPHAQGLVAEADITLHRRGRLAAKLLVFKGPLALRRFWKLAVSDASLGRRCLGAVNSLAQESGRPTKDGGVKWDRMIGDRRYFCVIGLCVGGLSMEIIAHEAVHAGFCYERRVKRNLFGEACDFDEERIAYPAGAIAAAINRFLHAKGLYEEKP